MIHILSSADRANFLFTSLHCSIILTVCLVMLCTVLHCSVLYPSDSAAGTSCCVLFVHMSGAVRVEVDLSLSLSFIRLECKYRHICSVSISSLYLSHSLSLSLTLSLTHSLSHTFSLSLSLHPQTHQETCGSRVSTYDCVFRHGQDH
jgi:hypothetical protein